MKQAIVKTLVFTVIIVLLELAVGYYQVKSEGGSYSLANFRIGLIPLFVLAYFLIQVFKFRRSSDQVS